MSEILKSCPFCGGRPILRIKGNECFVECYYCYSTGRPWRVQKNDNHIHRAYKSWNERAEIVDEAALQNCNYCPTCGTKVGMNKSVC